MVELLLTAKIRTRSVLKIVMPALKHTSDILELRRLGQKDHKFKTSRDAIAALSLKKISLFFHTGVSVITIHMQICK